jgi:hypothetical protein
MAEGDATVYNHFKELLLIAPVNLGSDTLKVILLDTLYSVDPDGAAMSLTHVDSHEISGSGYTPGGCTLASEAVTQRDTADDAHLDADDLTWANLGTDLIQSAVLYDDTLTATNAVVADPLMIHWEITTNSNGGNYTLQWGASGILVLA